MVSKKRLEKRALAVANVRRGRQVHREYSAVRALHEATERNEEEVAARRKAKGIPANHSEFRCQECRALFDASRMFNVSRAAELYLMSKGYRTQLTPTSDILAEACDAPKKWCRCPECGSSDIAGLQSPEDVEAGSTETTSEVAVELHSDLGRNLERLRLNPDDPAALNKCFGGLWELCATLSRHGELMREAAKLSRQ